MKCLWLVVFVGTAVLQGQSISIAVPANNATISGLQYVLQCTVTSISKLASVEYDVEDELIAVVSASGQTGCPSYNWNTFEIPNGAHVIKAIARDALNNVLASSADQAFTVQNTKPCSDGNGLSSATISISPGTSISSNWSGYQSISYAKSGTECAGSSGTGWYVSVDGKPPTTATPFSGGTVSFDTREFFNGTHLITIVAQDTVGTGSSACTSCDIVGSWQRQVTFSNTGSTNLVPVEFRPSAAGLTLTTAGSAGNCNGGSSCTLTGTEYATDNSTISRGAPLLFAIDALGVVSVSGQTITAVSPGVERVIVLDPWYTSTTLSAQQGGISISDSSAPGGGFQYYQDSQIATGGQAPEYGWCADITSSTGGWHAGLYDMYGINVSQQMYLKGPLPLTSGAANGTATSGHGIIGPCREIWVTVSAITNSIAHFSRNGSILTAYDPNASIFSLSLFNAGGTGQWSTPQWAAQSVAAGWNVLEGGLGCLPGTTSRHAGTLYFGPAYSCGGSASNQAAWHNDIALQASMLQTDAQTNHYYLRLIGTSWAGQLFTFVGAGQLGFTYSPTAIQDASQIWGALNVCTPSATQQCYGAVHSMSMHDEVDGQYGNVALPGGTFGSSSSCGTIGGTCGPTQIVAASGSCVASWQNGGVNAGGHFVIQGATTSSLNTNYPSVWASSSVTTSALNFSCAGVPDGTYNASTDPSLTINPFANSWGSSTDYLHYNALATFMGQANAASPTRPRIAWPPRGIASYLALKNWVKDSRMSDYTEVYYPGDTLGGGAFNTHLQIFSTYMGRTENYQQTLVNAQQDSVPFCTESTSIGNNYSVSNGNLLSVTSFINDVITVSVSDHGFRNVAPSITRVTLSGMSNSSDNGNYYVRSFPTANTIQVVKAASFTNGTYTLTFDNGDVRTGVTANHSGSNIPAAGSISGCWLQDIGHTFTIGGVSGTFWFAIGSNPCGAGQSQNYAIYQVPSGSSTSGSVAVIPDNYYHLGATAGTQVIGVRYQIASQIVPFHLGASCLRGYIPSEDADWVDAGPGTYTNNPDNHTTTVSQAFQVWNPAGLPTGSFQSGVHPSIEQGVESIAGWWGSAMPNLLIQRLACYTLGNRLASPDYGLGFLASARTGSCGTVLFVSNLWDSVQTRTITLSPYLIAGQPIWKYYCAVISGCTMTQLAASTSSDTVKFDSAATVWYVFANNAAVLTQPVISVGLADVPNAANVIVRYAYTQYALSPGQVLALPFVADCGTGTCTLPVDRQIGTVYFQVQYLDANGRILATGSIETM